MTTIYFPLYYLDTQFWHTSGDAYMDVYPINEVKPEDIGHVYEAWHSNDP